MGTVIAPRTKQCATTAKTSEWERAGPNPGGPGGLPPALFLPISREKWGPRRAGGPPGALRPEAPYEPRPPKGYVVPYRPPARDRAGTHVAGPTLRWSKKDPPIGQSKRRAPKALSFPITGVKRYCATSSQNRMRMVAIWAREALPAGFRVPSSMPWMMFSATAQAMAGWA